MEAVSQDYSLCRSVFLAGISGARAAIEHRPETVSGIRQFRRLLHTLLHAIEASIHAEPNGNDPHGQGKHRNSQNDPGNLPARDALRSRHLLKSIPCKTFGYHHAMSAPLANHPLLRPFWGQVGVRHSKSDSLTLNDFTYKVRLDEDTAEFEEQEFSYHDSALVATRVIKGTWAAVKVEPQKVVLRISGGDGAGAPAERILVLLPDDVFSGTVEWGLKHHS